MEGFEPPLSCLFNRCLVRLATFRSADIFPYGFTHLNRHGAGSLSLHKPLVFRGFLCCFKGTFPPYTLIGIHNSYPLYTHKELYLLLQRPDSNRRPSAYETDKLPTALPYNVAITGGNSPMPLHFFYKFLWPEWVRTTACRRLRLQANI